MKRSDGQHGGGVANAAVWQRSQSTGCGGKRDRKPPAKSGRECGHAHHILGHSRIVLQNQLFRRPHKRQLPMDIDGSTAHSRGDRGAMAVATLGRPSGCGGWARQCDLWTSGRGPSAALVVPSNPRGAQTRRSQRSHTDSCGKERKKEKKAGAHERFFLRFSSNEIQWAEQNREPTRGGGRRGRRGGLGVLPQSRVICFVLFVIVLF